MNKPEPDDAINFTPIKTVMGTGPGQDPQDRLTLTLNLYFEQAGEQPVPQQAIATSQKKTANEEPWSRRLSVQPEWTSIDFGWCRDNVGIVLLINKSKTATVEVSFNGGASTTLIIPPSFPLPLFPSKDAADGLMVRAVGDIAKLELFVTPA